MTDVPKSGRRAITVRRFATADEADRADLDYWLKIPAAERVLLAWQLSREQWMLAGQSAHEPRLHRSVRAFIDADARFLVVGAYALAFHGRPRATGDLDVWVEATPENAERVMRALGAFGAPLAGVSSTDLSSPGVVFQIGVPPGRIDVLTELTGLTFAEAWPGRVRGRFGDRTPERSRRH